MDIKAVNSFPCETVDSLLSSVSFFRTIKQSEQYQYDILLQHSKIIEYRPGEVVLEKGRRDAWLYFLLKGQLEVVAHNVIVNYITPGEVFGDLAMLFDHVRTATVTADANAKKVLVFGMDVTVFGNLEDTHPISRETKLAYYRNMVHNIRWKLEVYRSSYPGQVFASSHRKIKLFSGSKDSLEELLSLHAQARALAKLLVVWNSEIHRLSLTPRSDVTADSLRVVG